MEKTRLGIPIIVFDEAVHGLAREGATMFPQAIAMAATWDAALVGRVSTAIARETRTRGVRQVLSPVVNIADDVRWGRVEETYGEDPFLASAMGDAFVEAFEKMDIVTTPKHLVANVGEGGRDSYPIDRSERMLAERFYPPFKTAIERGGARSVMTAYNSVDGMPATQNRRLLTDLLRRRVVVQGFRDLRRGGDGWRHRAAHDRTEYPHCGEARMGGRSGCRLSILLASTSALPRGSAEGPCRRVDR